MSANTKMNLAVKYLKLAVAEYDALPYFEPEHWYLPPRHCLGEALLRRGEYADAASVFREDLTSAHPRNPWALKGLRRASKVNSDEDEIEGGTACFEVFRDDDEFLATVDT